MNYTRARKFLALASNIFKTFSKWHTTTNNELVISSCHPEEGSIAETSVHFIRYFVSLRNSNNWFTSHITTRRKTDRSVGLFEISRKVHLNTCKGKVCIRA